MKKQFFLTVVLCFILLSCNDDWSNDETNNIGTNKVEFILKERDPRYPWTPPLYKSNLSRKTKGSSIGINQEKYLGMSYKNAIYPFEDTRNLGYPVINYAKLYKDNPSSFRSWKVSNGEATRFSYSDFTRYSSNSSITKKIDGGFKLSVAGFSLGNKKSREETFSKSLVEDSNTVFGELNVVVRDSVFNLQFSSNIKNKIRNGYLDEVFLDELYNTHTSEFYSNYGGYILTNYTTGGKATALYTGRYKKTESSTRKETKMNQEMDASYKFDPKKEDKSDSVGGNLSLGRNKNNSTSITNEFSSIMLSVKTLGGNGEFASFSTPSEVKNTNIDLSKWLASLTDKKNSTIIEFGDNGLIPIIDFIPEFALRVEMLKYMENGVNKIEELNPQEPFITIALSQQTAPRLEMSVNLHTSRTPKDSYYNYFYHDYQIIPLRFAAIGGSSVGDFVKQEAQRFSKMFGVKIVFTYDSSLDLNSNNPYVGPELGNEVEKYFDEKMLKKCVFNGITYLVSDYVPIISQENNIGIPYERQSVSSFYHAYSIREEMIDAYGLRDLIDRLPTSNISFSTLMSSKYRINGLL